jgi:hypothetical protein
MPACSMMKMQNSYYPLSYKGGKKGFHWYPEDCRNVKNFLPCEIVRKGVGDDEYSIQIFLNEGKFKVERYPKDSLLQR